MSSQLYIKQRVRRAWVSAGSFVANKHAIWLVIFVAFMLRLPLLNGSFWLDEAAQALESARPFSEQWQIVPDFQPPLLHYIVHGALYFSRAEWWLRGWGALLPGLATIWFAYHIARRLHSRAAGFVVAVLLATSSFHVFYSQELRPYMLPAFFAAWSWGLLVPELFHEKSSHLVKWRSRWPWWWFVLASVGGVYSSYLYPFVFAGQLATMVLWRRELWRIAVMSSAGIALAFLPWLPLFRLQLAAGQELRQDLPGWEKVVSFDQVKSLALTGGKFLFGVVDLQVSFGFVALCFLVVASLCFALWRVRWEHVIKCLKTPVFALALGWLVLPVLLAWLISFWVPVLQPKRVLFALPAWYLLLSVGTAYFARVTRTEPKRAVLPIVALLVINVWGLTQYWRTPQLQREDWRDMHAKIVQLYPADAGAAVIFAFPEAFAPWRWYDDGTYPVIVTGVLTTADVSEMPTLKSVSRFRYVLVFDYLRDLTDPGDAVGAELRRVGFRDVAQLTPTTPLGIVHVYARPSELLTVKEN